MLAIPWHCLPHKFRSYRSHRETKIMARTHLRLERLESRQLLAANCFSLHGPSELAAGTLRGTTATAWSNPVVATSSVSAGPTSFAMGARLPGVNPASQIILDDHLPPQDWTMPW
jgi:hypothetical protein